MVLTAVACGFDPRCARETDWKGQVRATRITDLLAECKYSIHDLSRRRGQGDENLARLNMAFELGMAFGIQQFRSKLGGPSHEWLVMGPPDTVIDKVISDLKGFHPVHHNETVPVVIMRVWDWLTQLPDFKAAPTAGVILDNYPKFVESLEAGAQRAWSREQREYTNDPLPWNLILNAARETALQMPT